VRLVRVDHEGTPRYGALVADGETVRLLSGDPFGEPRFTGEVTSLSASPALVPVTPTKVVAVGRNYARHAAEMGFEVGTNPSVFLKPLQTLLPHGGAVVLPPADLSDHVEHEAELAVVIGKQARRVLAADAFDVILGFTCADDVSARDLQRGDPQLTRGKGFDTFCPLGLAVETDVSADVEHVISCRVNGDERQRASTAEMLFPIPHLIEWISKWTTLEPGDVILTGSPAGTGPLSSGDQVEIEISGVGSLSHGVVAAPV
jgi:2-keto-4-pentenoate hydratase/2-oxohepta-3-ene-1,7-dioic acid hydratase in catechol pathway